MWRYFSKKQLCRLGGWKSLKSDSCLFFRRDGRGMDEINSLFGMMDGDLWKERKDPSSVFSTIPSIWANWSRSSPSLLSAKQLDGWINMHPFSSLSSQCTLLSPHHIHPFWQTSAVFKSLWGGAWFSAGVFEFLFRLLAIPWSIKSRIEASG